MLLAAFFLPSVSARAGMETCSAARASYRSSCCGEAGDAPFRSWCTATSKSAGGTLYTANLSSPEAGWTSTTNLGLLARTREGCTPGGTPHMVLPSPDGELVGVSYTTDSVFHILSASTKALLACIDVPASSRATSKVHTATWAEGAAGELLLLLVDMTYMGNGTGALHKFTVDAATGQAAHVSTLEIDNPDVTNAAKTVTKPIAMGVQANGVGFVTDAKGGGVFVNVSSMEEVGRVGKSFMTGNCYGGGLWVERVPGSSTRLLAQYGTQGGTSCLLEVDVEERAAKRIVPLDPVADRDAHGLAFCSAENDLYVLNTNRVSATFNAIRYSDMRIVANASFLSSPPSPPPGVVVSPPPPPPSAQSPPPPSATGGMRRLDDGEHVAGGGEMQPDVIYYHAETSKLFLVGRGPDPVSALQPDYFNADARPGVYVFALSSCTVPVFETYLPADASLSVHSAPDMHGGNRVKDSFWAIDQTGSGKWVSCEEDGRPGAFVPAQ